MSSEGLISNDQESLNLSVVEDIPDLSKYCEFFKFFLVEELALEPDYSELHYGKCSVIGKLKETEDGDFFLENIKLPNLESEYSLPEGSVNIRLLRLNYFGTRLRDGKFCEVCGEVVLLDVNNPIKNRNPLTSRGVQERLHTLPNKIERDTYLEQLKKTHRPALKVLYVDEVPQPGELAELNLEIRLLIPERKESFDIRLK